MIIGGYCMMWWNSNRNAVHEMYVVACQYLYFALVFNSTY